MSDKSPCNYCGHMPTDDEKTADLVAALEFYANPKNWERHYAKPSDEGKHYPCHATLDRGRVARKALAKALKSSEEQKS